VSRILVVIPTYLTKQDDLDVTLDALKSVRSTAGDSVDLLCVDDGSPEGSLVDRLAENTFDAEVHRKEDNSGFSKTVNVGLSRARDEGKHAVLMNADVEIQTHGWPREFASCQDANYKPAAVVGALLLFPNGTIQHAGVYFCQPPHSKVLTVQDGYVPIGELDPASHGLVSYSRKENRIFRCKDGRGRNRAGVWAQGVGYPFEVGHRPYSGPMLGLDAGTGLVEMTPNHKLTVFWSEEARGQYAVYVMRRGSRWRVGHTQIGQSNGGRGFGPRLRMNQQGADAVWVLSFHPSREEALYQENLLAWQFGVPTLQFRGGKRGLPQARLDQLWGQLDVTEAALQLLGEFGRDPALPLYESQRPAGRRLQPFGPSRRFEVAAANLMPEFMRLPVDVGRQNPELREFTLDEQHFEGDVYSLDVKPHHHYISDGVVVKNSNLTRTFDHLYKFGPGNLPEALEKRVCPVTGALQFIRLSTLERVGLFDNEFYMGWEDVDYCLRVFLAGEQCVYNPSVRAFHYEMMFRGEPSKKLKEWQAKSWYRLAMKYENQSFAGLVPNVGV
jgi:GT2 family glycosyltransferase